MQHMKGCWFIEAPIISWFYRKLIIKKKIRKICIGTKYLKKYDRCGFVLLNGFSAT